jgi:hypothetical protein
MEVGRQIHAAAALSPGLFAAEKRISLASPYIEPRFLGARTVLAMSAEAPPFTETIQC